MPRLLPHLRSAPPLQEEPSQPTVRDLADGLAADLERQRVRIAALMEHLDGVEARLDSLSEPQRPAQAA